MKGGWTRAGTGAAALAAALGVVLLLLVPAALAAAGPPPASSEGGPVELPETLTQPEVRDLVSRLSDEEVRGLLIAQLDKLAAAEAGEAAATTSWEEALAAAEGRLHQLVAALPRLPRAGQLFVDRLTEGQEPSYVWTVLLFAVVVFAGAGAVEWVFRRSFTQFGASAAGPRPSAVDRLCILAMRLLRDLLALGVFALVAVGIFFALFEGHEPTRILMAALFRTIVIFRAIAAVARFALAPFAGGLRIPDLGDDAARSIYRRFLLVVGTLAALFFFGRVINGIIADPRLGLLYSIIAVFVFVVVLAATIWAGRRAVADSILGDTPEERRTAGWVRHLLAANWHLFATGFVVLVGMLHIAQRLIAERDSAAPILTSIAVLFAVPVLDWALKAGLTRALGISPPPPSAPAITAAPQAGGSAGESTASPEAALAAAALRRSYDEKMAYRAVLLKNLRIIMAVVIGTVLAAVWDFNLQAAAAAGFGARLAGSLYDIVVTLILASAVWGIIRVAIRQAVARKQTDEEEHDAGEIGGKGGTRLETLVPLLGNFLLITLAVIVTLIILSSLGVDIGPLIAGAGVVGIAIGFGAQTLVRDILSGMFFLIDDAFRVGEYINVGSVQGAVEHISIRSLRLRHHNGPLHTIPFGEITHLTNFSRDWAIMKLEMRVPFDADLEQVRKIIKRVGQEMMDDAELGKSFLQPVKSQGVHRMDDSAFIIRVKFMAKPGEQFVLRREVFRRIQEAFAKAGIRFAPRRVIVDTGVAGPLAAAAAAAAAIAEGESKGGEAPNGEGQDT